MCIQEHDELRAYLVSSTDTITLQIPRLCIAILGDFSLLKGHTKQKNFSAF